MYTGMSYVGSLDTFKKQGNVLRYTPGLVLRSILRYSHEHGPSILSDWKTLCQMLLGQLALPRVLASDLRLSTS